ncbi:helix-turn-helix transcriptional regulator [Agrobacterium sp. S2]|nr:helix-turn-helix transcriptional regulator [Agrobacterium sp. S2]
MTKPTPAPTNRIAEIRKRMGLTQAQLAEKVGVHWITISKLERGQIQFSDDWKDRLAEALNVEPDVLLPVNRRLTSIEVAGEIMPGGIVEQYTDDEGIHTYTLWNGAFHALHRVWYYVNTNALAPLFHDEDLLCFARNDGIEPSRLMNRFCMILATDEAGGDRTLFGYPHMTAQSDRYTVVPPSGPPIQNVRIHFLFPLVTVFYNVPEVDEIYDDLD